MDINLYRYQLPFTQPLKFHGHTIQQREGLLLHWGSSWSEIAPLPGFSRETLEEAQQETIAFLTAFKAKPFQYLALLFSSDWIARAAAGLC